MKIHLISWTNEPLKCIAAALLNMGIGKDTRTLDDITYGESVDALKEIFKSYLDTPLEFASFNFFWEDIPLYLRSELERARVGWSYAERSLRFYQAGDRKPIEKIDWNYFPTIKTEEQKKEFISFITKEMEEYALLKEMGVETQEARNVIGVWYGTALQTSCTYRALRNTMALRLSSQAHPAWRNAANQIKELVTSVDKHLGEGLIDICQMQGRCVWQSKLDRQCPDCIKRGILPNHEHKFDKPTNNGMQCNCGILEKEKAFYEIK